MSSVLIVSGFGDVDMYCHLGIRLQLKRCTSYSLLCHAGPMCVSLVQKFHHSIILGCSSCMDFNGVVSRCMLCYDFSCCPSI